MTTNAYSPDWFAAFLPPGTPAAERELAFIERHLPPARHRWLLDVCCGIGRHANALAARGYRVLGLDRDQRAIDVARAAAPPGARYLCMDMRDLNRLRDAFDGALLLWSCFGLHDAATNEALLRTIAGRLPPGGRILVDTYNRDGLGGLPAREVVTRGGQTVVVTRDLTGHTYRVSHAYSESDAIEWFAWVTYSPSEIGRLAGRCDLRVTCACAHFDEGTPASERYARMQIVLEKPTL